MPLESCALIYEFLELKGYIYNLKVNSTHIRKLFSEYREIICDTENRENQAVHVATRVEEVSLRQLLLKNELFNMLRLAYTDF